MVVWDSRERQPSADKSIFRPRAPDVENNTGLSLTLSVFITGAQRKTAAVASSYSPFTLSVKRLIIASPVASSPSARRSLPLILIPNTDSNPLHFELANNH